MTIFAQISLRIIKEQELIIGPLAWDEAKKVMILRDKIAPKTIILGNGDVLTKKQGKELVKKYGLDGIMIGRGVFQNPWVFEKISREHTIHEKAALLLLHAEQYENYFTGIKPFEPLKRFYKIYINGFEGAAELREQLYTATTAIEVKTILASHKLI